MYELLLSSLRIVGPIKDRHRVPCSNHSMGFILFLCIWVACLSDLPKLLALDQMVST